MTDLWRRRKTPSAADAHGRSSLSAQPASNKNATDMFGNVCWDIFNNSGIKRYINGVFVCVWEADASLGKRRSMNVSKVWGQCWRHWDFSSTCCQSLLFSRSVSLDKISKGSISLDKLKQNLLTMEGGPAT